MELPRHEVDLLAHPGAGASEWLLTNGLGGFAMGCADGVNRRRYHGLLVGATHPPVGRVMALPAIADTVAMAQPGGNGLKAGVVRRALTDFKFSGWSGRLGMTPDWFTTDTVTATWEYRLGTIVVTRSLSLVRHSNAAWMTWEISGGGATLELRPLVGMRDFHALPRGERVMRGLVDVKEGGCRVEMGGHTLELECEAARFSLNPHTWWSFEHQFELDRGQDGHEDLLCPGELVAALEPSRPVVLRIALDGVLPADDPAPTSRRRLAKLLADANPRGGVAGDEGEARAFAALVAASDQFIVRRELQGGRVMPSIIAGYPWFSDWGRDTMISLPGLLLTTKRFEEALGVLRAFASMTRRGLVPNCFDDASGCAQHNTVDGSLWFIQAAWEYREASGDRAGFAKHLLPACVDVLTAYRDGTDFGIGMDPADALIAAGDAHTQLTWMDAARDGVVFTPRHGKAVEINALWVSGLRLIAAELGREGGAWEMLATRAGASFVRLFWNAERACLFDRLSPSSDGKGWIGVDEVRPNQIYAACLPHSPLSAEQRRGVLACVRDELQTRMGLRTLGPREEGYRGRYEGDMMRRDAAYHNGTAWPYLVGAYVRALLNMTDGSAARMAQSSRLSDALAKVRSGGTPEPREPMVSGATLEAADVLRPLLAELITPRVKPGPIGSLAEIYDGDAEQRPQGCPAQAWSVAEALRSVVMSRGGA